MQGNRKEDQMKSIVTLLIFTACLGVFLKPRPGGSAVAAAQDSNLFSRRYTEGQKLSYHMKATNKDRLNTTSYEAQADGVVEKDSSGHFYERYQWSGLIMNRRKMAIPKANAGFRQILSLDPGFHAPFPDMRRAFGGLIGPVLDLLTFYVDLGLAIRHRGLAHPGDHIYVKYGKPASWGEGQGLILGESSVDFDLTLQSLDQKAGLATLLVRHVPPKQSQVQLSAAWMRTPVVDTPNNWVRLGKDSAGRYVASVGKETFNDLIKVSLADGRIVSATMDNPVKVLERKCSDAGLTDCGQLIRYEIRRRIEIR